MVKYQWMSPIFMNSLIIGLKQNVKMFFKINRDNHIKRGISLKGQPFVNRFKMGKTLQLSRCPDKAVSQGIG